MKNNKLITPLPNDPKKAIEMIIERYDRYPVDHPERESIRMQREKYEKIITKR